ncbi:hypothetical protein CDAR_406831 [Caerostris darwini]|uniref:Uncharacterized protein n=1 Tax=Caerostris darwini TaxID=1538125 RepID=A0AAV4RAS6_9ARAC|nr:hypothetical protein CDAR_406831 [Caerostris darwini]
MFLLAIVCCIVVAQGQLYNNIQIHSHHAPSYAVRHSVRNYRGDGHRQGVGNAAAGLVAGNYGFSNYRGIGQHVNYGAGPSGLRAYVRTNAPRYGTTYQPFYPSAGHDRLPYPEHGLGYSYGLGHGMHNVRDSLGQRHIEEVSNAFIGGATSNYGRHVNYVAVPYG